MYLDAAKVCTGLLLLLFLTQLPVKTSAIAGIQPPITLSDTEEQSDDIHSATSGDYVYVVWKDSTGDLDLPFKAYFARSTDGGRKFGNGSGQDQWQVL